MGETPYATLRETLVADYRRARMRRDMRLISSPDYAAFIDQWIVRANRAGFRASDLLTEAKRNATR